MAIKEHYHEILDVLDELFIYIFENLSLRFKKYLDAVNEQYPFEPLIFKKPSLRLEYPEAIKLLREANVKIGDYDDFGTEDEKLLGRLVKQKYNTDFYILDKFPEAVRPFYSMPDPTNPLYANAYDLFLRGEEICSGSQRVHNTEVLAERAAKRKINTEPMRDYVEAFRFGAPPHGGAGIGLERVVMLYLGLNNIRKTTMFPRDPQRLTP